MDASLRMLEAFLRKSVCPCQYDPDSFDQRSIDRIQGLCRVVETVVIPYHRAEVRGLERIPQGPALYVGNHNAGLLTIDTFIFGAAVFRARGIEDLPFFLTHDLFVDNPRSSESR